ncbi:PREDICTED: rhythmically expressed gene 5 protein isoform X2 [Eufriesea mexicana]|uniref:rhythmically expressed gene 5 protein isoform X2 n=1 Tax=Eufriesea mexicana TaxID=516756 RepID=UPI00083BEF30|nr:PREDICTED: rhythmically expressed gene 5 protein isoform X2 [Eufriesea mexicana]
MKNLRIPVLFAIILILGCHALNVTASAIPMWEFLSRGEKMSYLLRVFSLQVSKYCVDSSMPDCNKNLLVTGLRNLANMDNNVLDKLDPYQHDAKGLTISDSDINGIGEETMATHDYVRPSSEHTGPYLVGPMVIRVYPDGRPVAEDSTRPLPQDEDTEEFKHSRIPSIEEIETDKDTLHEKQLKENSFTETKSHRLSQEGSAHFLSNHSPFKRRLLQEVIAKRKIRYH